MINGIWRTTLADGETIEVLVMAYDGAGTAPLSINGCLGPGLQKRLSADLWAARLGEPLGSNLMIEKRIQLTVRRERAGSELPMSDAAQLAWPLIMADRCARGVQVMPTQATYLYGSSDDWLAGEIEALPDAMERIQALPGDVMVWRGGGWMQEDGFNGQVRTVTHLSELQGHPRSRAGWRRAAVWFPVVGVPADNLNDALLELRVMVRPWQYGTDEDDHIQVVGRAVTAQQTKQCARLLRDFRRHDRNRLREWLTVVHFPDQAFTDSSWQFAAVVADRIARGRDFCGLGKTVATGRIVPEAGETFGNVFAVGALPQKCELIASLAERHMRVLFPAESRGQVPESFVQTLRARGGGYAFVAKV